jgi:hypothetical protein
MSTLSDKVQRWRRLGSLRYLAHELDVSVKQVTRYWDNGWIQGRHRTPKGNRRIRYDETTVAQVRQTVRAAKETNIHIRYHPGEVHYPVATIGKMIRIRFEGCNSMHDLYKRARKAGLSKAAAKDLAFRPRVRSNATAEQVAWDCLWASEGTTQEEAAASIQLLDLLPAEMLMTLKNQTDFRAKADAAWLNIQAHLKGESDEKVALLRHLLSQPDLRSFVAACNEATELDDRIKNRNDEEHRATNKWAATKPDDAKLHLAALHIKHEQTPPTALALAKLLGISRPGLYRRFGRKAIQDALKAVRHDPRAANARANDKWAEGKKTNQGTRTALRGYSLPQTEA